ncbi:MAG TPA: aminomethyltransferase family protein [Candidatus Acidoferrales bacterium]|nr:aminomethyltransferase family protein [Candidatus Acidoferrales bacterium]
MNSELAAAEEASGATFDAAGDRRLPRSFGTLVGECEAVRRRCGLFDAGFRSLWRLNGGDRTTFLQGMVTNDVAKLASGAGTYAALLTIQGRVVSDMRIFALEEELWLDVPTSHAAAVRESLEKFIIADDVEFAEGDDWSPLLVVEGPQADRVALAVLGESFADLAPFAQRSAGFEGSEVRVAAVTHTGERGYLVVGPATAAATLWKHFCAAGVEPVGMAALDVLRVEAGIPWMGRDMDESTIVSEVGLDAAISFQKGCYLGQEVVERVAARGQVQRKLVGLQWDGDQPAPAQAKIWHADKEVGWITSAVFSPTLGRSLALGYLRREAWDESVELRVVWDGASVAAGVTSLPFYRPAAN